jgi:predicted transcriptional regulator
MEKTTREYIISYLKKENTWVTENDIREKVRAFAPRIDPWCVIKYVRNTRNIGYLHEKGYRYYDIPQEMLQRMEWMDRWWDSLPEKNTPTSTKQSRHNV